MNIKIHGLLSLLLVGVAVTISIVIILLQSILAGSMYLIVLLAVSVNVIKDFCAICPSRETCGHLIPGYIAKTIFPNLTARPFTKMGFISLLLQIALIVVIPQYWLFKKLELFILYWLLFITAGIEIFSMVCKKCTNGHCPSNRHFKGFARKINNKQNIQLLHTSNTVDIQERHKT